jgi:hypothetical protein
MSDNFKMKSHWIIRFFAFLAGLQMIFAVFVFFVLSRHNPILHAVFGMALGLFVFWIVLFGLISWKLPDRIRDFVLKIRLHWAAKFVIFCTALALLEEAITTAMTNLAPSFGVPVGAAYITASSNYWDVVLGHSVVRFIPIFIAWAYLLYKYDFKPNHVFLLFGLTGTLMEVAFSGPAHIMEIGMWMMVYGLMVYLPVYCLPQRRVKPMRFYHYFLPFLFAILFQLLLLPVLPLIHYLRPSTLTSFPPMKE